MARRAYPMIYQRIIRNLDDDRRLEIDAILGDPEAEAERQRRRRDAIATADIEIG
jgi:hypothetical protein